MTINTSANPPAITLKGERCQCAACGLYFAGERSFDRHRTGDFGAINTRRCKTTSEMLASNMEQTVMGLWRIGRKASPLACLEGDVANVLTEAVATVGGPSGATWARSGELQELVL